MEPVPKRAKVVSETPETTLVSILSCCYNGATFLEAMLESLLAQTYDGEMELCVFNDASTDDSMAIVESWRERFAARKIALVIGGHNGAVLPPCLCLSAHFTTLLRRDWTRGQAGRDWLCEERCGSAQQGPGPTQPARSALLTPTPNSHRSRRCCYGKTSTT